MVKKNMAVGAATGVRCWKSGMLLVLPGESGMLLVCLETQCKSDKIFPRREISVDHEHVLLLLLLTLSLRLSQCLLHHTESSGIEFPVFRKDMVHYQYLTELLSGGL